MPAFLNCTRTLSAPRPARARAHARRVARPPAAGALLALALLPATALAQGSAGEDRPRLEALQIDEPVHLDARLEEPFWQRADVATGFVQREPDPGQPATERTEIRVAYDRANLYIAVKAFDSEPEAILAKEMRRDGEGGGGGFGAGSGAFRNDDSVAVVIDTFGDRRNAFYFETNPTGARGDALVENEGRPNFQWDGVWRAAGRRAEDGWVAEIAIPFKTLRFDPELDTWGINFRRLIRRKSEEAFWSPVGIDADISRVSLAGSLDGIRGLRPGLNLRVKPYVVGSSARNFLEPDVSPGDDAEFGLDQLRWGLSDSVTLDVTVNTDFAQVEADDQRVNLTRFSLFFPEKREFFLENAGIFQFGPGGGGGGFRPPLFQAFFSRRIGIAGGGIVPLAAGARLTGRVGGWNFGLLDIQTDGVERPGAEPVPSTNWGVLRLKRNLGARSSVGAIVTNKQVSAEQWNRIFGLDADINPTRRLHFEGFFVGSSDGLDGDGWAGGTGFAWRGRIWRANAEVQQIDDNFDPEMGFLLRRGIRRYNYSVNFEPRPRNDLGVRNLTFNQRTEIITRTDGTLETVDATLRFFGFDLRSGDRLTLFAGYNFERLFAPFEIFPGVVLPPGDYDYADVGIFLRTDGRRPVSFFGFYTKGGFWNGTRFQGNSTLTLRLGRYVSAETSWNINDVSLPEGSFTTNVLRQRVNVSFSPSLFWNTFVQINDADDLITLNSRLNWIYTPGADVFLVYNQDWDTGAGTRPANRALIFKFTYLLSL